jgi:hypothetical protein
MKLQLAVAAAALVAGAAPAEIVVQRWPAAGALPEGVELFSMSAAGTADLQERGQTFTSDYAGKLLAFDVLFARRALEDLPDPTLELSLFDHPGGTQLTSKTFVPPASLGGGLQWISVDFSDADILLAPGTPLFYRLVEPGVSNHQNVNSNIVWYGATGPSNLLYGGGQALIKYSGSCPACGAWMPLDPFGDGTDADMAFRLHIDSAVTAVPEPASWAMMIAGFDLLGVAVRRRKNLPVSFA